MHPWGSTVHQDAPSVLGLGAGRAKMRRTEDGLRWSGNAWLYEAWAGLNPSPILSLRKGRGTSRIDETLDLR